MFGVRNFDVTRQPASRAELVIHHRADAGMLDGRAGFVPGQHVVSGDPVIRHAADDRPHDAHFVSDLCTRRHRSAEHHARNRRLRDTKRPAIFQWRFRLRIPRFLSGNASSANNLNHARGGVLFRVTPLLLRLSRPNPKEVAQRHSSDSQRPNPNKLPTRKTHDSASFRT